MRKKYYQILLIICCLGVGSAFAQAPTNGLQGYWPFTKNAIDSASGNNNGTVYGATLVKDRCGNDSSAYYFDGNDYIDVGTHSSLRSSSKTVNFWFKYTDTTAEMIMVGNYNSNSGEWGHNCRHHNVHGLMTDLGSGPSNRQIGFRAKEFWNDNEWHMFSSTYDKNGNILAFYIDGCFLGYKNWDITSGGFYSGDSVQYKSGEHWIFGASSQYFSSSVNNGPRYFTGALDEVRIYDRALSSREVRRLYDIEFCGCKDTVFITKYDTIDVYDTTFVTINDTTFTTFNDTIQVTVYSYDTIYIDVYDTTRILINDTTFISVYDTTFVTIYDTLRIPVYDTTFFNVFDTTRVIINDTNFVKIIQTTYHAVTDTLYIQLKDRDTSSGGGNVIKVYPNPSRGKIKVDMGLYSIVKGDKLKLYNIIGQLIMEQEISGRFMDFDYSNLARGHYELVFVDSGGKIMAVKRIILH